MPEDQMFDDLENMLGGQVPGKPKNDPISSSKFNAHSLTKKGSSSRIVPMADLDDLEDQYDFDARKKPAVIRQPANKN